MKRAVTRVAAGLRSGSPYWSIFARRWIVHTRQELAPRSRSLTVDHVTVGLAGPRSCQADGRPIRDARPPVRHPPQSRLLSRRDPPTPAPIYLDGTQNRHRRFADR